LINAGVAAVEREKTKGTVDITPQAGWNLTKSLNKCSLTFRI
jgi:hypothetical protein